MRKFLGIFLLLMMFAVPSVFAQNAGKASLIRGGATLPTAASANTIFLKTGTSAGMYRWNGSAWVMLLSGDQINVNGGVLGIASDGSVQIGTGTTGNASMGSLTIAGTTISNAPFGGPFTAQWSLSSTGWNSVTQRFRWVTPTAITLKGFSIDVGTAMAGCTTSGVISVYDSTTASNLMSITLTNGPLFWDASGSVNVASGDALYIKLSTAAVGCTTYSSNPSFSVNWKVQ